MSHHIIDIFLFWNKKKVAMTFRNIQKILIACITFVMITGDWVKAGVAAPIKLKLSEGFENPIGFYDATPTFSW